LVGAAAGDTINAAGALALAALGLLVRGRKRFLKSAAKRSSPGKTKVWQSRAPWGGTWLLDDRSERLDTHRGPALAFEPAIALFGTGLPIAPRLPRRVVEPSFGPGSMGRRRASNAAIDDLKRLRQPPAAAVAPRIGLALGGGFARGIAHAGVLSAFERHGIPLHCITGVSAGSVVAAAYASGVGADDIGRIGSCTRFRDVARWSLCRMGFMGSERMNRFLKGLLKTYRFEEMRIPLGVVATDLCTGEPVSFCERGDVVLPIRASCSYPGLFQPVRAGERLLVDGAMSIQIPALLARELGATHVISVNLPPPPCERPPADLFQVIRRCFQIMQCRSESGWRHDSDLVITPDLKAVEWNGFEAGPALVNAGEAAALAALPTIQSWFPDSGLDRVVLPQSCIA
jgi:NTE family protein